jgi:hypothetical protein
VDVGKTCQAQGGSEAFRSLMLGSGWIYVYGRKNFFFEKKKQKTFDQGLRPLSEEFREILKIFGSFLKREVFTLETD